MSLWNLARACMQDDMTGIDLGVVQPSAEPPHVGVDGSAHIQWAAGVPVSLVWRDLRDSRGRRKSKAILLERVPGGIPSCCAPVGDSGAGRRPTDHGRSAEGLWMSVYAANKGFGAEGPEVCSSDISDNHGRP